VCHEIPGTSGSTANLTASPIAPSKQADQPAAKSCSGLVSMPVLPGPRGLRRLRFSGQSDKLRTDRSKEAQDGVFQSEPVNCSVTPAST
jgi:hypothetical protein